MANSFSIHRELEEKLKVGLLLDHPKVPNWVFGILEEISRSDFARIEVAIVKTNPKPKRKFWDRITASRWSKLLYILYTRLDRRLFGGRVTLFKQRDLSDLSFPVRYMEVQPRETKFSDYYSESEIAQIAEMKLDVLWRLGSKILRGGILNAARHGVWSYHHGDLSQMRGGPAGFWEVLLDWDTTGSTLQVLTEELDGGQIIFQSKSATVRSSVELNRQNLYAKSSLFLPRMLQKLHQLGEEQFSVMVSKLNQDPAGYSNPLFTIPNNGEFLVLLSRKAFRFLRKKLKQLFYFRQWVLYFQMGGSATTPLWKFKLLKPPKSRFWADPCIITWEDKYIIFLEDFSYADGRGVISMMEMDREGRCSKPEIVLQKPYHLSYPFVFNWQGQYYMIPETSQNRKIELYRATKFPRDWEWVNDLMTNVKAVDSTLYYDQELWWLFVNIAEHELASSSEELFLFFSPDFNSNEWTPHPMNPIVSDVTRARPAGPLFRHEGRLYRPSQNCGGQYGSSINLNRVEILNTQEYEEKIVNTLEPNWEKGLNGVHTFHSNGDLVLVDALRDRPRIW